MILRTGIGTGRLSTIMDLTRERLALEYLESALVWPVAERDQRLAEALTHDLQLLGEVRELLHVADAVNEELPTQLPLNGDAADVPPPEQIGPYRVKELLGQGGM